jgi:phage replication O-like protein O
MENENFTKMPNEIIEVFARTNLNSYQQRVLWAIIRKTYGWHKKEDWIPVSQIVEVTGIHKPHVSRTLKELKLRNMVTRLGNKTGLNENWKQWRELPNGVTPYRKVTQPGIKVTHPGNKKLPNRVHSKEKKETLQKKTLTPASLALAGLLFELIQKRDGKVKADLNKWAVHIDRLIRIDKRSPEEIMEVIKWCQHKDFWSKNILSTKKLRAQYPTLYAQMDSEPKGGTYKCLSCQNAKREGREYCSVDCEQRATAPEREWQALVEKYS